MSAQSETVQTNSKITQAWVLKLLADEREKIAKALDREGAILAAQFVRGLGDQNNE